MFRRLKINAHERGLLFREREFLGVLKPGVYWRFDPLLKLRLQTVDPRNPWLVHKELDLMVKSGRLGDEVVVVDLLDHERALVWIDGRFAYPLKADLYARRTRNEARARARSLRGKVCLGATARAQG